MPSLSQMLLVVTLAITLDLSLPEQSGLLKSDKSPAQEAGDRNPPVQEAGGRQRVQEAGERREILRPDELLINLPMSPNQQQDRSQLKIGDELNHEVKMAIGQEFAKSVDLSIDPWSWEPQRTQPRRRKTHFLTKKFQEKSGRDLLKRQTSFITEHDQASEGGFENVVVKTADYDKGEKAIVRPSKLPPRNLESDRPAPGGLEEENPKKCIDSDKLLFCISTAKVLCPNN